MHGSPPFDFGPSRVDGVFYNETDREIGEEAFIGARTVVQPIGHILDKAGIANGKEAAS